MALVDRTIPNLWGGVSQQPDGIRQDNQCAEQINAWGSIISGLKVRPNTDFVEELQDYDFPSLPKVHVIERDSSERYIVIFTGDATTPLRIYDTDGQECTVRYGQLDPESGFTTDATVKDYLTSTADPRDAIRANTVADYTIVVNNEITCDKSGTLNTDWTNDALIYVKKAVAHTRYIIEVNGTEVYNENISTDYVNAGTILDNIVTALGSNLSTGALSITFPRRWGQTGAHFHLTIDAVQTQQDAVYDEFWYDDSGPTYEYNAERTCEAFEASFATNYPSFEFIRSGWTYYISKTGGGGFTASVDKTDWPNLYYTINGDPSWTVTRIDGTNTIRLRRVDGGTFTIKATDEYDNNSLIAIQGKVQKITDLPARAPDGFYVEVTGDSGNNNDSYYLQYNTNDDGNQGSWEEVVKKGLDNSFDPTTLPHRLVRTDTLEFTLAPCIWDSRICGDDDSSPDPSFIGKVCRDVFLYKDRLGFLSGENVVLSRTGDYFNFWRGTALEVLDDDPIDVGVASAEVTSLYHAVALQARLIVSSDVAQYSLGSGDQPLTPKTVAFDPATKFNTTKACRPVAIGPNVYLASPVGNYSRIREYFVTPDTLLTDAADVTAHCPQYVPSGVTNMFASTPHELLFVLSSTDVNSMWVYATFWQGDQKVQSAWSRWDFGDGEVLGGQVLDNYVYLVMKRDGVVTLERADLEDITHITVGDYDIRLHLDCLAEATFDRDEQINTFNWASFFTVPYTLPEEFVVVNAETGKQMDHVRYSDTEFYIVGTWTDKEMWVGLDYESSFTFSKFVMRAENSNVDVLRGKLTVRNIRLHFKNTGYFRVEVTVEGRDTCTYEYRPVVIGNFLLNTVPIDDGYKQFPVLSNARKVEIKIVNDSHLPSTFEYASWKGTFNKNSRTV